MAAWQIAALLALAVAGQKMSKRSGKKRPHVVLFRWFYLVSVPAWMMFVSIEDFLPILPKFRRVLARFETAGPPSARGNVSRSA